MLPQPLHSSPSSQHTAPVLQRVPGTGPTNEHQSLPLEGRQPHHLLIGNDIQLVKNWGAGEKRHGRVTTGLATPA